MDDLKTPFNYQDFKNSFKVDFPETFNYAFDVIDKYAETERNRLAMIWINDNGDEKRITFWELKVWSNKIANLLQGCDIDKGDKVLIMLPRIPQFWYTVLALMKVGAIAIPSAISLSPKDLEYRCNRAGIKMVITNTANVYKFDEIRPKIPTVKIFAQIGQKCDHWLDFMETVEPASRYFIPIGAHKMTKLTDPFLMYFTSGTTGYPKIVSHDYSYSIAHKSTAELWHDLKANDIHWTITDTGWAKLAWGAFFGQWIAGATIFIYEYDRFKADMILKLIEKYGITTFCAPPTAYRMLVLEDLRHYDFSELRRCTSAGEPLNPEVIEIWKKAFNLEIAEGYGQTETVIIVGTYPGMKVKYGAMGLPNPMLDVDVIGDDLKPMAVKQEGDVAVKVKPIHPHGVFKGYFDDPVLNKEVFKGDWYLTGDRAYRDEDGYFWFVGRSDDVIKSSGYRIGPFEVESALVEHPAVVESAVIGVPDKMKGQRVKAFVVLHSDYEPSESLVKELQEHVKKVTAFFKSPREIEFVKELPKTVSGKIRRIELREREIKKLEENG